MAGAVELQVEGAVTLLARTTGNSYALVGRLTGGETGAHEIRGPHSERLVMKWDTDPSSVVLRRQGVVLSERLRTVAHWPVPRQRTVTADGCLFVLQDLLPGTPLDTLGPALLDRLLALHHARLALARPQDPSDWPAGLIRTLTVGGKTYCLHQPLRTYDGRTASLVERMEDLGRSLVAEDFPGSDIVHWDLHAGNILHHDGRLTAIVDTDFTQVGDAAFDLVSLAVSSLALHCTGGVRRRLFAAAFDGLDDRRRRAYLAHLFLRNLDWPIRRGCPQEVEFWLARAHEMLDL